MHARPDLRSYLLDDQKTCAGHRPPVSPVSCAPISDNVSPGTSPNAGSGNPPDPRAPPRPRASNHPATEVASTPQRSECRSSRRGLPENGRTLRWAKGYDVESVSPRAVSTASQYTRNQRQQHPAELIPGWPPRGGQENRSSEASPAARIVISSCDRS